MGSPKQVFEPIPCIYCGEPFTQKRIDRKHCNSKTCIDTHRKKLARKYTADYRSRAKLKICAGCKEPFTQMGRRKQSFCSKACNRKYHNDNRHQTIDDMKTPDTPTKPSDAISKHDRPYSQETMRWGIVLQSWTRCRANQPMAAIEKAKEQ